MIRSLFHQIRCLLIRAWFRHHNDRAGAILREHIRTHRRDARGRFVSPQDLTTAALKKAVSK
jgi:hypothetical protein